MKRSRHKRTKREASRSQETDENDSDEDASDAHGESGIIDNQEESAEPDDQQRLEQFYAACSRGEEMAVQSSLLYDQRFKNIFQNENVHYALRIIVQNPIDTDEEFEQAKRLIEMIAHHHHPPLKDLTFLLIHAILHAKSHAKLNALLNYLITKSEPTAYHLCVRAAIKTDKSVKVLEKILDNVVLAGSYTISIGDVLKFAKHCIAITSESSISTVDRRLALLLARKDVMDYAQANNGYNKLLTLFINARMIKAMNALLSIASIDPSLYLCRCGIFQDMIESNQVIMVQNFLRHDRVYTFYADIIYNLLIRRSSLVKGREMELILKDAHDRSL